MAAKILIVDDDLQSLKLVGLMLQRRGHTIVAARNGVQGLDKAEADPPDLIILDVMMPDLDGLEVCRRLRSQPSTSQIPIMLFTAKSQVADKVGGFQSGADDYLTKPIHPDELVARVDAALQRRAKKHLTEEPALPAQADVTLPLEADKQLNEEPALPTQADVTLPLEAEKQFNEEPALPAQADAALPLEAQKQLNEEPASLAQIIGFLGAKGGVGTTTLALNAAAALTTAGGERRVILVDLQASAANVAVQLGLKAAAGLATLASLEPNRITPAVIRPRLVRHASGLQLLLIGADQPAPAAALTAEQLTSVIGSVSQLAQVVVLDLGSTLDDLTLTALALCRHVVLALEPQRIAVVAAQNLTAQLERRGIPAARVSVAVINRAPGAVILGWQAIEAQLQRRIDVLVPPVPAVASQAADKASLIIQAQPGGLFAEQIRTLAQHLMT